MSPLLNKFKGNQSLRKIDNVANFTKEVEVSNKRSKPDGIDIDYETKKLAKMSAPVNTNDKEQIASNSVTNIVAGQNASHKITLDDADYDDLLFNQLGNYF